MQLPIGRLVAERYRVVGVLGRGGMAVVHEAHDEVLDRRVALKVLAGHLLDDAGAVRRFEREATSAAGLNHPNIVGVHDAVADDDVHALVMELVEGRSLADRLRDDGPLPVDDALAMADQVSAALGAAHDRGLVHRDVKPSNILLTGDGTVKVADFGIARAMSPAATQTAVVMGSVPYVAPEQLRGESPADPRSDLYALGCVLHEALTGNPPFTSDTSAAVLGQHLHATPPSVSRDRPDAGPAVDALVASLLAKDVADRPSDAHDLRQRLARVRDGLPPVAGSGDGSDTSHAAATEVVPPLAAAAGAAGVAGAAAGTGAGTAGGADDTANLDDAAPTASSTRHLEDAPAGEPGAGGGRSSGTRILAGLLGVALLAVLVLVLPNVLGGDESPTPAPPTEPATSDPTTEATQPAEPSPGPTAEATTAPATEPATDAATEAPAEPSPTPSPPAPTPSPTPAPTTPPPAPAPAPGTAVDEALADLQGLVDRGLDAGQVRGDAPDELGDRIGDIAARLADDDGRDEAVEAIDELRVEVDEQVDDGNLGNGIAQQIRSDLDDLQSLVGATGDEDDDG